MRHGQLLTGAEAASAFRELATMLDDLVPLFDCGCRICLHQAAKNMRQLGEELGYLVDHLDPEVARPHIGGSFPDDLEVQEAETFSARAFQRLAGSLRMHAAALERGG